MIKISDNYAIGFDKYNIIMQERYEKREDKGRNAALSGEFGYRDIGFHGNFKSLVSRLVDYEIRLTGQEVATLEEIVARIEALKAEIEATLNEKIVLSSQEKGD